MNRPRFVIESSEAESMAKNSNLTILQLLSSLVKSAQTLARPPISNFHVGAVGLGSDGRIFVGVNLEFPGLPLHHSIHAEQFLVTNLAVHGQPRLRYIAVSAAPCGHCRQFLQELRCASDIQILITNESENPSYNPLSSILPNPFGPRDLLDDKSPWLLEKQNNRLSLLISHNSNHQVINSNCEDLCRLSLSKSNDSNHQMINSNGEDLPHDSNHLAMNLNCQDLPHDSINSNCGDLPYDSNHQAIRSNCGDLCNDSNRQGIKLNCGDLSNGVIGELISSALKAANNSHAPYSGCPSGVALMDCEGEIYRGSYMESAAYNPSLGPVQAAVVAYVAGGGGGYERIVAAVLVEKGGASVRQEDTARLLLKVISPKCEFRVFHCVSSSSNGCK